jgi:hypothetical protein
MWLGGGTVAVAAAAGGSSTKTDMASIHDILFADLYQEVRAHFLI